MKKKDGGFRTVLGVITQNWSVLICFELIYKEVGICFVFPFIDTLFSYLPGLIQENYLSQENFVRLLTNPAAIAVLAGIGLLLGGYLYIEMIALTLYSEMSWRKEHITVWKLVCMSVVQIKRMFTVRRFAVFFLLLLMPLSFFGTSSMFLRTFQIPEFILASITDHTLYLCLLLAAVLFINYMFFLYLFGIPCLLLTDLSFSASWKESRRLLYRKKISTARRLLACTFIFIVILFCIWLAAVGIIGGSIRGFYGAEEGKWHFGMYYDTFSGVWNLVKGALISVFLCAMTVVLYHSLRGENRPAKVKRVWSMKRALGRTAVVSVIIISLLFLGDTELGRQFLTADRSDMTVVAHRGGAAFGPENTIGALHQAIEDGADMAEIDVQQLKDGTLIVMHDTNFKRTTGVDLNVWDAVYQQVKGLDAGSYYSAAYAGEQVPTLEAMLQAAKGKIDLMIELKGTGHEKSLVQDAVALIEKYNMEGQCNIASLDIDLLKQAKMWNPEIKSTYITVLLVSETYDLEQIDQYSIETTFLTRDIVYQAHDQGKAVFGWTASNDDNIKKVIRSEADGIVTDNPMLVRYHLDTMEENILKEAVIGFLF